MKNSIFKSTAGFFKGFIVFSLMLVGGCLFAESFSEIGNGVASLFDLGGTVGDVLSNLTHIGGAALATGPVLLTIKGDPFEIKSKEDLEKLTDEEREVYMGAKFEAQTNAILKLQKELQEKDANKDEIEIQIKELTKINMASMKSQLETMGTTVAKLTKEVEAQTSKESLTFQAACFKGLIDNKDAIKEALKTSSGSFELEIKASQGAADIDAGTDFAEMEAGVGQIATRLPFMRQLFVNKNTSKEYVKYNDQETIVRDAKNVAACAASTHNSKITWKVRTMQITKVRDFVDVCIDMMEDYDFVEGEIRGLVETDVKLKVDEGLLLGDNIYPNTNSVDNVASTFAAGSYATSIPLAQIIDLLKIAGAQISDFGQNNKFQANVILLNPVDACKMQLTKDVNGVYLIPSWITSDGVNIGAMRVIENQLVPVNEAYVMDSTKGTVYSRKGLAVSFGFENKDNFEKELVTVKAYERLNFRVRNVDANAFMHIASLSAAITAITKP